MSTTEMLQVMDAPGKAKGKTPEGLKGDDLKAMFRAMFFTRLLKTDTLDDVGRAPSLRLASTCCCCTGPSSSLWPSGACAS